MSHEKILSVKLNCFPEHYHSALFFFFVNDLYLNWEHPGWHHSLAATGNTNSFSIKNAKSWFTFINVINFNWVKLTVTVLGKAPFEMMLERTYPPIADHRSLSRKELQNILTEQLLTADKINLQCVEFFLKGIYIHALQRNNKLCLERPKHWFYTWL